VDIHVGWATAEATSNVVVAGSRVHPVTESFVLYWMEKVDAA